MGQTVYQKGKIVVAYWVPNRKDPELYVWDTRHFADYQKAIVLYQTIADNLRDAEWPIGYEVQLWYGQYCHAVAGNRPDCLPQIMDWCVTNAKEA